MPDQDMPEALEKDISKMLAMAAPQVLAQSQAMVAQQQAQQNAQDPVLQLQMEELAIKKQDSDTKAKKVQADAAAKADELDIKREQLELEKSKKAAADVVEGFKLAGDVAKSRQSKAKPTQKPE
jgi:hypothetical protein